MTREDAPAVTEGDEQVVLVSNADFLLLLAGDQPHRLLYTVQWGEKGHRAKFQFCLCPGRCHLKRGVEDLPVCP